MKGSMFYFEVSIKKGSMFYRKWALWRVACFMPYYTPVVSVVPSEGAARAVTAQTFHKNNKEINVIERGVLFNEWMNEWTSEGSAATRVSEWMNEWAWPMNERARGA